MRADLNDFVACYDPDNRHERSEAVESAFLRPMSAGYWRDSLPEDLVKSESSYAKLLCGTFGKEDEGVPTCRDIESHSVEVFANTQVGFNRVSS